MKNILLLGGGGFVGRHLVNALNRELKTLRGRQRRYSRAIKERQRQRRASGARTVGLAGYTIKLSLVKLSFISSLLIES